MSQPQQRERTQEPLPRRAYTLNAFCRAFGIGRTTAYVEIASGRLRTYTVGRARFISADAADAWQRDREREAVAA